MKFNEHIKTANILHIRAFSTFVLLCLLLTSCLVCVDPKRTLAHVFASAFVRLILSYFVQSSCFHRLTVLVRQRRAGTQRIISALFG